MLRSFVLESRGKQFVSILDTPDKEKDMKILVFFCHGFAGHKITPHRMMPKFTQHLVDKGYTVCRTDCVGSGDSQGNEDFMVINGQINDYKVVLEHLKGIISWEKLILMGYSMGGTTATLLSQYCNPDGLLLWSPVSDPYWNFYHLLGQEIFMDGMNGNYVSIEGDEVSPKFFENLDTIKPLEIIKELSIPIRIVHGDQDKDVLPINGWTYNQYAKDGEVYFVEGAGHTYDSVNLQNQLFEKSFEYLSDMIKEGVN